MPHNLLSDMQALLSTLSAISNISALGIIAAGIIAVLTRRTVRRLGNRALAEYSLEPYENVSRGVAVANILYRILAPAVVSLLLYSLFEMLIYLLCGVDTGLGPRWVACFLYWIVLIGEKIVRRLFLKPLGVILECLLSLIMTIIFDIAVTQRVYLEGFAVFDSSNIAFQLLIAIFYILVYAIAANFQDAIRPTSRQQEIEKQLYSYRARFDSLISSEHELTNYYNTYLFRSVLYSIMYIEDHNRPKSIRILENALCRIGLAKTTGIMQCKDDSRGGRPFSDEESVLEASTRLVKIWDDFIRAHVLSDAYSGKTWIGDGWYSIETAVFEKLLIEGFDDLYGSYRGSKLLDCKHIAAQVVAFEKRESFHAIPERALICSGVFSEEAKLFPNSVIVIEGGALHPYGHSDGELEKGQGVLWIYRWSDDAVKDFSVIMEQLTRDGCQILSVNVIHEFYCRVVYQGSFRGTQSVPHDCYHYKRK